MERSRRFEEAIRRMDDANRADPRVLIVDGTPHPRELAFARRVSEWVEKLTANPSEELRLAARGHTLRRWMIPRDQYPKTTVGYHQWRDALARFHAQESAEILRDAGYDDQTIDRVSVFIRRENWPEDREACVLEDADCLAFLELKLSEFIGEWDEEKAIRILARTLEKMTPDARSRAAALPLGEREQALVKQACAGEPK